MGGSCVLFDMLKDVCKYFSLRSLAKSCNPDILTVAFYGKVHPHLSYGIRLRGFVVKINLKESLATKTYCEDNFKFTYQRIL